MRPWHLEARVGRDSRDYADAMGCTFTTRRETVQECRERTAAEPQSDEPGSAAPGEQSPARRFRFSCGFFEHDAYTDGDVEITVRLTATPSWNDAVQLVLPAIYTRLTRSTGQSAWRPTIASLSVLELLNWAGNVIRNVGDCQRPRMSPSPVPIAPRPQPPLTLTGTRAPRWPKSGQSPPWHCMKYLSMSGVLRPEPIGKRSSARPQIAGAITGHSTCLVST